MKEWENDRDGRRINPDALREARALRDEFAARHGVLTVHLVQAARSDRTQSGPVRGDAPGRRGEVGAEGEVRTDQGSPQPNGPRCEDP